MSGGIQITFVSQKENWKLPAEVFLSFGVVANTLSCFSSGIISLNFNQLFELLFKL